MANNACVGVNNISRKAKSMYIGVDGVARKVKHAYIGVDGLARLWYEPDQEENLSYNYVSLGDSIAVGYSLPDWGSDYVEYGVNGNTSTRIVRDSYTWLIRNELVERYGADRTNTISFARSGDRVTDLIDKLSHDGVRKAIQEASLVTVCIGANDVLQPAMSNLEEYINTGDLSTIAAIVESNLANLNNDSSATSYRSLFNKLTEINPNATYVFTTVYNPYKYLWLEDGVNGFFKPVLDVLPDITILNFIGVDEMIRDGLMGTASVRQLFDRVNGLGEWAEKYVTKLNQVLKNKISEYRQVNSNFYVTDSKLLWESFPDRPLTSNYHYNDLVNVEFTRGYNTETMNWGALWAGSDPTTFWMALAAKYVVGEAFDLGGLAAELVAQTIVFVIMPDVDPHPEEYGHYAIKRSFADTLGWQSLYRHTVTYNANGGFGSMEVQEVVGLEKSVFAVLKPNGFTNATGYRFTGWNGVSAFYEKDGSFAYYYQNVSYNTILYAQWNNLFRLTYKHTNATELYDDDQTGHQECYALYINGELKPKFGTFASGSVTTYEVPYGSTIRVWVDDYVENDFAYDEANCSVYMNGNRVAHGHPTEYTFTMTSDVTIDFWWEIAGSWVTLNAQSWEDCYITTNY